LRNKDLVSPTSLLGLFFELLRCHDKLLRKVCEFFSAILFSELLQMLECCIELLQSLLIKKCPLSLQTLYTHIVTDIKNINAKHKNNKLNTVSCLYLSWGWAIWPKKFLQKI